MYKLLSLAIAGLLMSGCAFTSSQVAAQYNKTQQLQYAEYAKAKAEAVKEVMQALTKVDRGGMKIELDESGRVKAIKYTERLDTDVLKQAMMLPAPKTYAPKSTLSELGDFFLKFGSIATPISSMWFGYKATKSNNEAQVAITKSNNERDAGMYSAFTTNYKNVSTTNTTNTVTTTSTDKNREIINNNGSVYTSDGYLINSSQSEGSTTEESTTGDDGSGDCGLPGTPPCQ